MSKNNCYNMTVYSTTLSMIPILGYTVVFSVFYNRSEEIFIIFLLTCHRVNKPTHSTIFYKRIPFFVALKRRETGHYVANFPCPSQGYIQPLAMG